MVNFDNESTITTAPQDLIKMVILERRYNTIQAIELYHKQTADGMQSSLSFIRSRLWGLFIELERTLHNNFNDKRNKNEEDKKEVKANPYLKLLKLMKSDKFEELNEAFLFINAFLYDVGLIKFDNKIKYNTVMVEEENKAKNL